MRSRRRTPRCTQRRTPNGPSSPPGFTIIEMAIALVIAAILAAIALPAVDFNRYRMDANARLVQNQLLWAQSRAVQRNTQVLVQLYYDSNQFRFVDDTSADGAYTAGENTVNRTLGDGMVFKAPPTTIDGATAYYATGAGVSLVGTKNYPQVIFYPNGSSSGDCVIYLGSPKGRLQDYRAIKVSGATSKMYFYRMGSNGVWALSEM